jgi:putative lipoic acid-binding regulatory protein
MVTLAGKKPEISYPTNWEYKVIGEDKAKTKKAVKDIVNDKEHTIKESKKSKTGKYTSFSVNVLVFNEDERLFFFEEFSKHKEIKYVV